MTTPSPDENTSLPDRHVDAAWRAASAEEPPAALDAAILAAAHREIGAGPQPVSTGRTPRRRRVWLPLAAAATIGAIAFGLLQLVTPDQLGAPVADNAVVTDVPSTAARRVQEAASTAGEAAPKVSALAERKDEPAARRADTLPPPAPATAALGTAAVPPARQAQLGKVAAENASDDTAVATQTRARDRAALPVADWIVLIRRLRDEGKNDEASKELAAFRAAHADHARLLPPDLRDWRPPEK